MTDFKNRKEITEAFRRYAAREKEPCHDELLDMDSRISDLAVAQTLSVLRSTDKAYVIEAVKAVYFTRPTEPLRKCDISARVVKFSLEYHAAESTVYGWLALARRIYTAILSPQHTDTR